MFKEKNLKFAVILHSPTYNSHWDSWRSILHYCILFYCTPLPRVHIEIHGDPYYIIIFCSTALLYLQFTLRFMEIHITLLFSVLLHSSTDNQHLNKWRSIIVCFFLSEKNHQGTVDVISSDSPFVDWHLHVYNCTFEPELCLIIYYDEILIFRLKLSAN